MDIPQSSAVIDSVIARFVHRLFPSYVNPAFVACPPDCTKAFLGALAHTVADRGVQTEVIDLRPSPATTLGQVTDRIYLSNRQSDEPACPRSLVVLLGFDLLEGHDREEPIYPFRSEFQFDERHLWLFLGHDRSRLARLFHNRKLPLYLAAGDLTPQEWR